MERKTYISDGRLSLAEYIPQLDDRDHYLCWQDPETQRGYNYEMKLSFEEYRAKKITARFLAAIVREPDQRVVGCISLSPEGTLPDLAFMIYGPYRRRGYGSAAFALGVRYCFEALGLDAIYAGCYEHNLPSRKILLKCGFRPHPQGNVPERHYRTGGEIIQYDFINTKAPDYTDETEG